MKKTIGLISLLILMMGLVAATKKQSISTFLLKLEKLEILKSNTIRGDPYPEKRK